MEPEVGQSHRLFTSDAGALMIASAVNGALGLAFWAYAARTLPVEVVGRSNTLIMAATTIGALSNLSLGPFFERFLPGAGASARRWILWTHVLVALVAFVMAAAFAVLGPQHVLFTDRGDVVIFVVTVIVIGAFALQDSILVGLLRSKWTAAKNIFHAAAKLVLLVVLGTGALAADPVLLAWMLPAAAAVLICQLLIVFGAGGLRDHFTGVAATSTLRSLFHEGLSLYGIVLINAILPFSVPLLVVSMLGLEQAAYFGVSWTLVAGVTLVLSVISGPFVARAATRPPDLMLVVRRQTKLLFIVALGAALILGAAGPLALVLLGGGYASAKVLLMLMAVVQILSVPGYVFGGLARVERKLGYALVVQAGVATGVVTLSVVLLPLLGITGVGVAYLIMELAMIAAVAVPIRRMLVELEKSVA